MTKSKKSTGSLKAQKVSNNKTNVLVIALTSIVITVFFLLYHARNIEMAKAQEEARRQEALPKVLLQYATTTTCSGLFSGWPQYPRIYSDYEPELIDGGVQFTHGYYLPKGGWKWSEVIYYNDSSLSFLTPCEVNVAGGEFELVLDTGP